MPYARSGGGIDHDDQGRRRRSRRTPSSNPTPRSRSPAAIRTRTTATSTRRSITPPRCSIGPPRIFSPTRARTSTAAAARRPPRRWKTPSRRSKDRPARASRSCPRALRPSRPRCSRCCKSGDHLLVSDSAYGPTRTFCDTILSALRRHDDLLRSADRRGHRRSDATEHPRGVHRSAGLAHLRDAGHSGDRRGRAQERRAGADGQHLGGPALFQGAGKRRRSVDPVRHQIHRRPFRPDARHRLRQQARRSSG